MLQQQQQRSPPVNAKSGPLLLRASSTMDKNIEEIPLHFEMYEIFSRTKGFPVIFKIFSSEQYDFQKIRTRFSGSD